MSFYKWIHNFGDESQVPDQWKKIWNIYKGGGARKGEEFSDIGGWANGQHCKVFVVSGEEAKWVVGEVQHVISERRLMISGKIIDLDRVPVVRVEGGGVEMVSLGFLAPGYIQLISIPGGGGSELHLNRVGVLGDGSCLLHAWRELCEDRRPMIELRGAMVARLRSLVELWFSRREWDTIWDHLQWVLVDGGIRVDRIVLSGGWEGGERWAELARERLGVKNGLVAGEWPKNDAVVCSLEDWQDMMAILWSDSEWQGPLRRLVGIPREIIGMLLGVGEMMLRDVRFQLRPHLLEFLEPRYNLLVVNLKTGLLEQTGLDWIRGRKVMLIAWVEECHYEALFDQGGHQGLWDESDPVVLQLLEHHKP